MVLFIQVSCAVSDRKVFFCSGSAEFMHRCKCHLMQKTRKQRKSWVPGVDRPKLGLYVDSSCSMVDDGGVGEGSMVSVDMDAVMDVYGPYKMGGCHPISPLCAGVWVSPITFRSTKEGFKVTQADKSLIAERRCELTIVM